MRGLTYLRWMLRDSRGSRGRMVYFTICLAVGVAAVVGTAALGEGIRRGFARESRTLLGADLTIDAQRALPEALDRALASLEGVERSDTIETMSMVSAPGSAAGEGRSRLAEVLAVRGRYPLYGEVVTEPPGGLAAHLRDDTVVPEADLLATLGLSVGNTLRVGGREFRIAATASGGPQPGGWSALLAPRLYLTRGGFDTAGLLRFGSRARHRALLALPGHPTREALDDLVSRLEAATPDAEYLDFDTHYDTGRGRRWVERMEGFVGLLALLSLVIGGIGVALIVRTWLTGRTRSIAVMRCLGLRPAQIVALSLGHTALLSLVGSAVGAGLGCALPPLVRAWAPDLLPVEVVGVVPVAAVLRGLALGVGLALAFALPPLSAVWRISPARVLRADAQPLPPNRWATLLSALVLLGSLLGAALVQADRPRHALWFTAGFLGLFGALFVGARVLLWAAARVPRRGLSPYLVHGVSALARPGAGTTGTIVALGLGTMVVTAMGLVESRLRAALVAQIPERAPSVYLVDVQPDERSDVEAALAEAGATDVDRVPVVMARIAAIDGRPVADIVAERERSWSLTREQRLTWRRQLTPDNVVTAGSLWTDPDKAEVSVEEGFARRLGVGVGSSITFDVQGTQVTLHVTSLRSVEWQSMSLNFFLVAEPGSLEGAPALYVVSARVPPAAELALQDRLSARHGSISVLRVGAILDQVLGLLGRIAEALRALGAFTILAGLAILAGAVSATVLHRAREVALLKTLGVTRLGVARLLATEYGLLGALAGGVGAAGALLLAWAWLAHVAHIDVSLPWLALPVAALAVGLLAAACGVLANLRALRVRPRTVLR